MIFIFNILLPLGINFIINSDQKTEKCTISTELPTFIFLAIFWKRNRKRVRKKYIDRFEKNNRK